MKVQLFGVGVEAISRAITAQSRINCYVEPRREGEKTTYALVRRPGLRLWTTFASSGVRGMHVMSSIDTPLIFVCSGNGLYSINAAFTITLIGTISTSSGPVFMQDDGKRLVLVDGILGWTFNTLTNVFMQITDGNFTKHPGDITWQDTYFITVDSTTNQFQLSNNNDATVWPALNIAFTQTSPGNMVGCRAHRSLLVLFADFFTEFWQDTGDPSFPYSVIRGSSAEFGLTSPSTIVQMEDTLFGVFQSKSGGGEVSYLQGYQRTKVSNTDIEHILNDANAGLDSGAYSFGVRFNGHPFYGVTIPNFERTLVYDGLSTIWSEWKTGDSLFVGNNIRSFFGQFLVSDRNTGNIYVLDDQTYDDNGGFMPMEVTTRHIWNDDKFIGISRIEIDVQTAVATTAVPNPQMDLQVSKDGGNSFQSMGFRSFGKAGAYTQRLVWNSLGAARDWILRLRVTDAVPVVITGASAEMEGGPF